MGVFIIAEAGVNHNGDVEIAKELIRIAADCGCNAVKFQTFKADKIVIREASKAEYQIKNTGSTEPQYEMLKRLELDYGQHQAICEYCGEKGIMFLSTPFDEESADMLYELGVEIFKIPSGEITNKPLIKHIAKKGKPIILSTGMADLGEVEEALDWIYDEGNHDVTLLHCTSDYPTKSEDVNLKCMLTMKEAFKVKTGYSDHTLGIEIPVAAAALGAEVIEKHFTLDRKMEGVDHNASLEPEELRAMVTAIRNVEVCLGNGIKKPTSSEMGTRRIARKSIVAAKDIKKGEIIARDGIALKRPGTGIEPKYFDKVLNRKAARDLLKDTIINEDDFI